MTKTLPKRFSKKINFTDSCWLWSATKNDKGYGQYYADGRLMYAHRFSWTLFNGQIPNGLNVLHKCDVPNCVNPKHLFLGTQKDNTKDMFDKGRQNIVTGENNGQSKLTDSQIREIREIYRPGKSGVGSEYSQRGLAKKYGVSVSRICEIVNRKNWKNVQ